MPKLLRRDQVLCVAGFLAILGVCLWTTWPALSGPFMFDDIPNLAHLASLNGQLTWASIAHYTSQFSSEPGRPLAMLSFIVNDYAWPSDPWSFKYTNLMLHLLSGVAVFGLARAVARLHADQAHATVMALVAMAAWLLHPMQLSTSMLVIQRMTELSALFSFFGLWGYVAIGSRATTPLRAAGGILVLGIATVLSTLCKENGALTPLLAVVLNATLLRSSLSRVPSAPRRILQGGTILPVLLLLGAIAWKWSSITSYEIRDFGMAERVLTQFRALTDYLWRILVPTLRGSGIYHDDFVVSRSLLDPGSTLPAAAFILALLAAALATTRRAPLFSFAVLWFFAGHLLESTVFPLEMYFEHRNYLPMFGPLFALSMAAARLAQKRRVAWLLPVAWILFAAGLTAIQAPIWGSRRLLTTTWALEHPQSPRAVQQYADFLYRSGEWHAAANMMLQAYDRGVRGSDMPLQVLLISCVRGDPALAQEAKRLLPVALSRGEYNNPTFDTITTLRTTVQSETCPGILTEAEWLSMTDLVLRNRNYANSGAQAYVRLERGYLFRDRLDLDRTMAEFELAYQLVPSIRLSQLIAGTLLSAGLPEDAVQWLERGIEDAPMTLRGRLSQDAEQSKRTIAAIRKEAAGD